MRKTKQILLNLSLLFLTVALFLLIGEVSVRSFTEGPDDSEWVGNPRTFYEYDPLLGWRNIPNTDQIRTIRGEGNNNIRYQINSRGIRGPEYSYEKAGNEYRVLLLGDSYTEGYVVEFANLFSEVMKRKLNTNGENIYFQTINSGTSGWSTDQELLFFQNEGKKYKPDLTILLFYQNDLSYNNQPKDFGMSHKPLFIEKNGELVLTNVPVPKPDKIVNNDQLETGERSIFGKLKLWLHKNSYFYGFIKERIKSTHFLNNLTIKLHLKEMPKNEDDLLPREYNVWKRTYNEPVRESWHITEAMLVKLQKDTTFIGSKLLVFHVPHEASVYQEMWKTIKNNYGFADELWSIDQVSLELGEVCRRNGIDFFDPTELFRTKAKELQKDKIRLYDHINEHWNDAGNEFVGELLADYVGSKYIEKSKLK